MSPFPMSPPLTGHSPTPPNLVHHPAGNMWSDHHISPHNAVGHHGLLTTAPHHGVHAMDHGYMYSSGITLTCICKNCREVHTYCINER